MKTIEQTNAVSRSDKALLDETKRTILDILPDAMILLYGSVAVGTRGPESDYDLLVLTEVPVPEKKKEAVERGLLGLELSHDVILSTIYHAKEEWRSRTGLPFHEEVEKHGLVL